jgi:hypothetical protein
MTFTFIDVEVEAAGAIWNVSFDRRVGDDGAEWGVTDVVVNTHERGELDVVQLPEAEQIEAAIVAYCAANPMSREDVQPDYCGSDY